MHRLAARTLTVVSLAGILAAGSLPASARSPHSEGRGKKKPVGEVVSFDAATSVLVVDLTSGETLTAPVADDAQVKLEHRGWAKKKDSKEHGNPTRGSLDDLVPGATVLRLKLEDDAVTKVRLRPAPAPAPVETPVPTESDDEDSGDEDSGDDATETSDEADDDSGDDSADDTDDENPDDDDSGDLEDALPPLPAP